MKVLVACEESQRVCTAFRERGHEAYSCDVQECSGGHPEWHIMQDVLPLINGHCEFFTLDGTSHQIDGKWDLLIAHPPCTYLSNVGARHLYKGGMLNSERYAKGLEAKTFFMKFYLADCEHICVENPVPSKVYQLPNYTQIVQPYMFGHPYKKSTCLWLKNLSCLKATDMVSTKFVQSTKIAGNWFNKGGKDRQKNRAKTFPGIAKAMAEQWG
ncbi:MAG: DNA cytosine methyltransferase [Oscillospiraceae bacterium]|nr:DNA cytosine methyltransferase [Oscillospiraceae bacterium]